MDKIWIPENKRTDTGLDAIKQQQKRRDAEPMFFCKLITRWPIKAFVLALCGQLFMMGLTVTLYLSGYDILPLYLDNIPSRLIEEPWDARWLAWNNRNNYTSFYTREKDAGFRNGLASYSTVELFYESFDDGNIFIKSTLLKMRELEQQLMKVKNFDKFCRLDTVTGLCVKPWSVLRFFDGTMLNIHPVFNDQEFENIKAVLYEAYRNNATGRGFRFFLSKNYDVSQREVRSHLTRSVLEFGNPHELFSESEYITEVTTYSADNMLPLLQGYKDLKEFKLSYSSIALFTLTCRRLAKKDLLWAGASFAFIFFIMLVHIKSMWITGLAIFSIFVSFLTTNLVYNIVLSFKYIGYFHFLTLFIGVGIGVDDVFVFYNVWRHSGHDKYVSLAHRLSDCYKKSMFCLFATSFTTAVAFLSCTITPLLALISFGTFSALVVFVNYFSVMLFFPTVVIVHHLYFEKDICSCCSQNKKCSDQLSTRKALYKTDTKPISGCKKSFDFMRSDNRRKSNNKLANRDYLGPSAFNYPISKISRPDVCMFYKGRDLYTQQWLDHGRYKQLDVASAAGIPPRLCGQNRHFTKHLIVRSYPYKRYMHTTRKERPVAVKGYSRENGLDYTWQRRVTENSRGTVSLRNGLDLCKRKAQKQKKSAIVRFFRNYYFSFVTNKYMKWIMVFVLAVLPIVSIYAASTIEPDNEMVQLLPDGHPITKAIHHRLHSFVTIPKQLMFVYILFGVKPNDLSGCHFSDPSCNGRQDWDPGFNPNTVEAQVALMNFCETLRTLSVDEADDLHIGRHPTTGQYNINCFPDNLQAFLLEESQLTGSNWSLPFTTEKVINFTSSRPHIYNTSVFTADFDNHLEIPISYWLHDRYNGTYTSYYELIGEEIGAHSSTVKSNPDYIYGNNLKFLAISVETNIEAQILGYREGEVVMKKWEQLLNKQLTQMPRGLQTAFQVASHERWSWITKQRLLVENAMYGIGIGLSLACLILIVATGNLITGLLATLSLCCCTVCVIGVIGFAGWTLGMKEAVHICMVVGLSVDYVLHLAEGYKLSLHHDRLSRVRDMLDLMAVSVCFGACTTIGASVFMLFTVLSFFSHFGILLLSTIGFSLLFSMGLFVTLLGIMGPEGETGNVVAMVKRLCNKTRT